MESGGQDEKNDTEILNKLEDERFRLQRQVRVIEADRLHRTTGVHPQLRRQDMLLGTLKKEYINLLKDLKIARSGAHKKKDKKMKSTLKRALLQRIKSEIDSEEGTTEMHQLEELFQKNLREMLQLKKITNATTGQLDERRTQSESRLMATENKLEAAMLRFNLVQTENKKIRDEISHMLKDRAIFNKNWAKMMNSLSKGKKFLTDLFESSTLAYDQRDEWCTKLKSTQEKGKMDQMLQVQEMRELKKAYDNEIELYNFLAKKGLKRINMKQEERAEEEKRLKEEEEINLLHGHLKILRDIYDYTKETDIENIIEDFEMREQENFSIYKLLNDFCAENQVLSHEVTKLRRDIDDRRDWNDMMSGKREEQLDNLNKELEIQMTKTHEMKDKHDERKQLIDSTMEKISDIFKMLDCSIEPYQNLLGDKEPSLNTFDLSLRLINEKIKEYIHCAYYYERLLQKKEKSTSSRLKRYTVRLEPPALFSPHQIGTLVPTETCPACVEARWLSRVSESLEVPFDETMSRAALAELASDPAYMRSDRIHTLSECRVPSSRGILARRYLNY
ncbi:coiled-coil domain-containing protein 63 [Bombyx mori]|uniref:ODAD1 central coiled coil region domain-containing protein n=1 Tax=Bombyx mori TaxID=7091 RepID=A0A8R2M919_BOMMO|nr:coiled-coil domain-containing protein 63 [Bombyx mori]